MRARRTRTCTNVSPRTPSRVFRLIPSFPTIPWHPPFSLLSIAVNAKRQSKSKFTKRPMKTWGISLIDAFESSESHSNVKPYTRTEL
jgi:hypothetical protein